MKRIEDEVQARTVESRLRQLFVRGLAGDAGAYHEFLKDLSGHLRAFLRKRLFRLPDDVEDLVQETLLAIHTQRHTYRQDQPLTAWVYAIARYKLVDLLRQRYGRESLNDPLDDELEIFAASAVEAADARRDLGKLLETLPDRQAAPHRVHETRGLVGCRDCALDGNVRVGGEGRRSSRAEGARGKDSG